MALRANTIMATRGLRLSWCCSLLFLLSLGHNCCRVQAEEHRNISGNAISEYMYDWLVGERSGERILAEDDNKATTAATPTGSGDDTNGTTTNPPDKPTQEAKGATDVCLSATGCPECLKLLTDLKDNNTLTEEQVCMWHEQKCTTESSDKYPNADQMCAASQDHNVPTTTAADPTGDDHNETTTGPPPTSGGKDATPSPTIAPTPSPTPSPTKAPTEGATTETPPTTEAPTKSPTKSLSKAPSKTPTETPTKAPTKEPTDASTPETKPTPSVPDETTETPAAEQSDEGIIGFSKVLFGVVLVIFACYCYKRRKLTSHFHHHHPGDMSGPRYEGISTREKDDEDDWDWDDDGGGGGGDVELGPQTTNKSSMRGAAASSSSYQQPMYRDHHQMPRSGRHNDRLKRRSNSGDGSNEPPSPAKAVSPKKQQPLMTVPRPKKDDIFAEMGFAATPSFDGKSSLSSARAAVPARAPPVQGLGAVQHLPLDDNDGDWGDDSDLDDLLND